MAESYIIAAVLTNSGFICWIIKETGKSSSYWEFCVFSNILFSTKMKAELDWFVICDNGSIHHSAQTVSIIMNLSLHTMYLSPYSPNLAPAEQFLKYWKQKWGKMYFTRD